MQKYPVGQSEKTDLLHCPGCKEARTEAMEGSGLYNVMSPAESKRNAGHEFCFGCGRWLGEGSRNND